jgi:hypothetical protein
VFKKKSGQVAWCLLLFPLAYGVASSPVKYFVKEEVDNHQHEFQKTLKVLGKLKMNRKLEFVIYHNK